MKINLKSYLFLILQILNLLSFFLYSIYNQMYVVFYHSEKDCIGTYYGIFLLITFGLWFSWILVNKYQVYQIKDLLIERVNFYAPFIILNSLFTFNNILCYYYRHLDWKSFIVLMIVFISSLFIFKHMMTKTSSYNNPTNFILKIYRLILLSFLFIILNVLLLIITTIGV